jgi:hypothetical protein
MKNRHFDHPASGVGGIHFLIDSIGLVDKDPGQLIARHTFLLVVNKRDKLESLYFCLIQSDAFGSSYPHTMQRGKNYCGKRGMRKVFATRLLVF